MYDLSKLSRNVEKMFAYRLACIFTKQEIVHPLMSEELIKDEYIHYLQHEPKYIPLIRSFKKCNYF